MSKLLLDEHPLMVMPKLAAKIGLNEAIILQQIHYWNTEINPKANNNFRDGYYWTFNTYEGWTKQFPFWSESTIKRALRKLEKMKLVQVGNYNKLKIDRTKWYRIDYDVLETIENTPLGQNDLSNGSKRPDQQTNMDRPLPETNSEISSENKTYTSFATLKDGNVFLDLYGRFFKAYMEKDHMRIANENISDLDDMLEEVQYWDEDMIRENLHDYFTSLPNGNNGNVLSFAKAYHRYR